MKNAQQQTKKISLYEAYLQGTGRDIADDVFDFVNCFEFSELRTSANDNNLDDDYNNVMLWIADGVEVVDCDNDYIHCRISDFIEKNRGLFDKFLNEVYREEWQPQNMDKIESESEDFYDYYLEGCFGGLINGSFSDNDYTVLWRLICENKGKSTIQKTREKAERVYEQYDALKYGIMLTNQKHESAVSMIRDCPQNIYIDDWKREEKTLAKRLEKLESLAQDLADEQDRLFDLLEQLREEQRQAVSNYEISHLSSAYQESAVESAIDTFNDGDKMSAQDFADECCANYRDILKSAGFDDSAIYKGFKQYGDECQVQGVALVLYGLITR